MCSRVPTCVPTHTYYSHAPLQSRIAIYNPYSASYRISPVMDITHITPPIPLGITKSPMYALYVYSGHVCITCVSCTGHVIMCTRMMRGQNRFFSVFLRSPTGILKGSILAWCPLQSGFDFHSFQRPITAKNTLASKSGKWSTSCQQSHSHQTLSTV